MSMQRHDVWRCIDVEATLYKRHVPAGLFLSVNVSVDKAKEFQEVVKSQLSL